MHMLSYGSFARDVLKKIGIIKNPILVFGIIGALILNVFALRLDASEKPAQVIGGVIMHVSTILFLACFGLVYVYALFKLLSSQQELLFSEEAKKMLAEDRRQRAREAK